MGLGTAAAMGAVSLIGTGISAYGQYQSGVEGRNAGEAAEKAYLYNVALDEEKAKAEVQREAMSEYKKAIITQEQVGEQVAAAAAGGVVTTTGSPIDILTNSLANANLDIQIDKYNSELTRRGLLSEAEQEKRLAKAAYEEGQRKYKKGLIGAAATVAKGVVKSQLIGSGSDDFPSGYSGSGIGQE